MINRILKLPNHYFAIPLACLLMILGFSGLTNAQQFPLSIQFSPNQAQLKTNEEKIIKLSINSPQQISAFDLTFQTSGSLGITGFESSLGFDKEINPFSRRQISASPSRIAYIINTPGTSLPQQIDLYIKVKGTTTGEGRISIDYNQSQVLSGSGSLLPISPNQSATYNLNLSQSSPGFTDPSSIPPLNYPESTAKVNLKLKLYGAQFNSVKNLKGTVVAVGRVGDSKYETQLQPLSLNQNPDGTFSGFAAFPDFKDGNKFSLMVKVDKYLLRRLCAPAPQGINPKEYSCIDPRLTILHGDNNFDFSGISFLPGDLGLFDGILNSYDLSIVRNNLGQESKESIDQADLNYDGIVNLKDFEIITSVAGSTDKKADQ